MNRFRRQSLIVLAAALLGCSAVQVSQDYLDSTSFAGLRTYAWKSAVQEKRGDILVDNPLLDQRIRNAVDRSLADRGYRKAVEEPPDFLIGYELGIRSKLESDSSGTGFGIGFGSIGRHGGIGIGLGTGTEVRSYDESLLIISVYDAGGDTALWRGTGTRRVSEHSTPEEADRTVGETVDKILAQFPPR